MVRFIILVFYYYIPVALYLIAIYLFSSFNFNVGAIPIVNSDKFAHIFEYSILGYLFMRAYLNTAGKEFKVRGIFTTVFFVFLTGCFDEYHQLFVPERIVSLGDILADTLGGFIGSIFYIIMLYITFRKEKRDEQNNSI